MGNVEKWIKGEKLLNETVKTLMSTGLTLKESEQLIINWLKERIKIENN